jgi:uncharacterized cysteine cluster protein YcgN (CxxCxxCC family)
MNPKELCDCGALGLHSMKTEDLQNLRIIMESASTSMDNMTALSMLYAVRYELRKRCVL